MVTDRKCTHKRCSLANVRTEFLRLAELINYKLSLVRPVMNLQTLRNFYMPKKLIWILDWKRMICIASVWQWKHGQRMKFSERISCFILFNCPKVAERLRRLNRNSKVSGSHNSDIHLISFAQQFQTSFPLVVALANAAARTPPPWRSVIWGTQSSLTLASVCKYLCCQWYFSKRNAALIVSYSCVI